MTALLAGSFGSASRARNAESARQAGFSLMEVLVALVLAAILGLALLGVQYQSFRLAQSSKSVWESLNAAEEFFARQYPDGLKDPTAGEAAWTERKDVHFRLVLDPPRGGVRWYSLSLRTPGGVTGWDWPEPKADLGDSTASSGGSGLPAGFGGSARTGQGGFGGTGK